MIPVLVSFINLLTNLLVLLIIVDSVLSFFLSSYHPVRNALGRILNPLLVPIRRVVPPVGGFDFSPLVLLILVEILSYALINFLHVL